MIRVELNGSELEIESHITLIRLLEKQNWNLDFAAVAINSQVIPRSEWNTHLLHTNDRIEIVTPSPGG